MSHPIARLLLVQCLRYVASTQAFGMVVLHGGWMLLALATWGQGDTGVLDAFTTAVVRAFVRLGGVDAAGHGDAGTLFAAWAKLSLGVYLVVAAWHWLRGARASWAWWRTVAVSSAVGLAGYVLAIWPASGGHPGELAFIVGGFTVAVAVATAWAVGASRLADRVVAGIERTPAAAPDARRVERAQLRG
jgi:hypothetical protein